MSAKTFWDDRFTMLMACASPGSALAYHQTLAQDRPGTLRRSKATDDPVAKADEKLTALVASGRVVALP